MGRLGDMEYVVGLGSQLNLVPCVLAKLDMCCCILL